MKAYPNTDSNLIIQERSVQTFVKRVKITFAFMLLLGGCISFYLIYLPLNNALQTSLIDNFNQISSVNYRSLQNIIQRGMEGARSLSSRTMIKNAIEDYHNGKMSMDELITYTQPKYEDGAKALDHLVIAERFVDNVVISRYTASEKMIDTGFVDSLPDKNTEADLKMYIIGDHVYCVVLFPIVADSNVIGCDRIFFDLTDYINSLCTDTIDIRLLNDEDFLTLTYDAKTVRDGGEMLNLSTPDYFIVSILIQDNIHFISKQSSSILFTPINQLNIKVFITSVGTLLGFIITAYLYVVRFAKRELKNLRTNHIAFEKVVSEVNIDSLTKAGSRRYGTINLMRAFTDFEVNGISPAIIMFDIDCFKHINDSLGHDAGDRVLKELVNAVYKTIGNEDMLFRWGGDEFVAIFYEVVEENAFNFAGKILDTVSSLKIDVGDEMVNTTISMGISYFKDNDMEFSDALKRADQAMYISKAGGRNRVNVL